MFGITTDSAVFSEYGITTDAAVVLFKKFDEGRADLTVESEIADSDSLSKFIAANSLSLVTLKTFSKMGNLEFIFDTFSNSHFRLLNSIKKQLKKYSAVSQEIKNLNR